MMSLHRDFGLLLVAAIWHCSALRHDSEGRQKQACMIIENPLAHDTLGFSFGFALDACNAASCNIFDLLTYISHYEIPKAVQEGRMCTCSRPEGSAIVSYDFWSNKDTCDSVNCFQRILGLLFHLKSPKLGVNHWQAVCTPSDSEGVSVFLPGLDELQDQSVEVRAKLQKTLNIQLSTSEAKAPAEAHESMCPALGFPEVDRQDCTPFHMLDSYTNSNAARRETACLNVGCCWQPLEPNSKNPWCFFQPSYLSVEAKREAKAQALALQLPCPVEQFPVEKRGHCQAFRTLTQSRSTDVRVREAACLKAGCCWQEVQEGKTGAWCFSKPESK